MLNWLKIDNLALIAEAWVEFHPGFNVVTGETGAGKSILLGTIPLIFGARVDRASIRTGCERAEIAAGITVPEARRARVAELLEPAAIAFDLADGELCLRRSITRSGVRNFVNDSAVTAQTLKSLGELLADIHSASEHHTILGRARQLELLDRYGALEEPLGRCRACYGRWRDIEAERDAALERIPGEREAHELNLVVEDIGRIAPEPGEDEAIAVRHNLAGNRQSVLAATGAAVELLGEGENLLEAAYRKLAELERFDAEGGGRLVEEAALAAEALRELSRKVESYADGLELDEEEFRQLENRLSELYTLKRRYGPALDQVLAAWEDARERLELYRGAESLRREFDRRIGDARNELLDAAGELSTLRRETALRLTEALHEKLAVLGFKKSRIAVEFSETEPGPAGTDRIDIVFSANPGEEPRPLREVASSGELARLMLAVKAVLAGADDTPILIFDEIDMNLGGETAHSVGTELRSLARRHQILAISHLAQVAVKGERHIAVEKDVSLDHAVSRVGVLQPEKRADEIARLLGGGKAARQHAGELISVTEAEYA